MAIAPKVSFKDLVFHDIKEEKNHKLQRASLSFPNGYGISVLRRDHSFVFSAALLRDGHYVPNTDRKLDKDGVNAMIEEIQNI